MIGQVDSVLCGSGCSVVATSLLHGNHWEGEVRIFNLPSSAPEEPTTLDLKNSGPAYHLYCGVSGIQWVTRHRTIALACDDGDVRILSLANDQGNAGSIEEQLTLEDHDDVVTCVDSCDGKVISGSFDGSIKLWSLNDTRLPEASIDCFDGYVWDAKFMDPHSVVTATQGGEVQLHDLRAYGSSSNGPQIRSNNSLGVASLALSVSLKESNIVACGKESGTLDCFDLRKVGGLPLVQQENLHASAIHAVAFSEAGTCVVSGGDDGKVCISSLGTDIVRGVDVGHTDYVRALCWGPSDREKGSAMLVTGSWDSTVKAIGVKL